MPTCSSCDPSTASSGQRTRAILGEGIAHQEAVKLNAMFFVRDLQPGLLLALPHHLLEHRVRLLEPDDDTPPGR